MQPGVAARPSPSLLGFVAHRSRSGNVPQRADFTELEGVHLDRDHEIAQLRQTCLVDEKFRNTFNFLPIKYTRDDLYDLDMFGNLLS